MGIGERDSLEFRPLKIIYSQLNPKAFKNKNDIENVTKENWEKSDESV